MTLPTIRPIGMSVLVLDLNATTPDKRSQQVILSVVGLSSSFIATWSVELPYVGRRGTLAVLAGEYTFLYIIHITRQFRPASSTRRGVSVCEYDSS